MSSLVIPRFEGAVYDPWEHVAQLRIPISVRDDMPPGMWGATDGNRIWLNAGLSQVETRCTLTHECVHVVSGHRTSQPRSVEAQVSQAAAVWLVPDLEQIVEAARWARCHDDLADALNIDERMLRHRLRALTTRERRHVAAASSYGFTP